MQQLLRSFQSTCPALAGSILRRHDSTCFDIFSTETVSSYIENIQCLPRRLNEILKEDKGGPHQIQSEKKGWQPDCHGSPDRNKWQSKQQPHSCPSNSPNGFSHDWNARRGSAGSRYGCWFVNWLQGNKQIGGHGKWAEFAESLYLVTKAKALETKAGRGPCGVLGGRRICRSGQWSQINVSSPHCTSCVVADKAYLKDMRLRLMPEWCRRI